MVTAIILEAVRKANKLGAKGYEVIDCLEPQSASESLELKLITRIPREKSAVERMWYD